MDRRPITKLLELLHARDMFERIDEYPGKAADANENERQISILAATIERDAWYYAGKL